MGILSGLSSVAIISLMNRELVALLYCVLAVMWLHVPVFCLPRGAMGGL